VPSANHVICTATGSTVLTLPPSSVMLVLCLQADFPVMVGRFD